MGLFGKKPETPPASDAPVLPQAKDLGVVIRVMPKDFVGAEATLRVEPKPTPAPVPASQPIVPVAPAALPKLAPVKRSAPLWMWILIIVLILLVAGAVGYVLYTKFQPQPVPEKTQTTQTLPTTTAATTTTPTTPKETTPTVPVPSKDSDSDGLTDIEERMYGTDYRNPDSDGDTYLDGNEVYHKYDPMGLAPSTLLDTGAVKEYSNASVPWTVTYPVSWKASEDLAKNTVTFRTPNVATISVVWSSKDPSLTVEDWILANVQGVDLTTLKASYTKEGLYTLRSKDDLVAYIDAGSTVYVMTYALGTATEISYIQTFAMMINSLTIKP